MVPRGMRRSAFAKNTLHTSPVSACSRKREYTLPWTQYTTPPDTREPFWNRLVGFTLLRMASKNTGQSLSIAEFAAGVKQAINTLADTIAQPENHSELRQLLVPELCTAVEKSLEVLPAGYRLHLDVESVRSLRMDSVNSIVGASDPNDEHVISWLGQKVITSQEGLKQLDDGKNVKFTLSTARDLGKQAARTRLEFHIGVSFATKEKFVLMDEGGRVIQGSNQFKDGFHYWKFSSPVDYDADYPFQWKIQDINNFMHDCTNS